MNRLFHSERMTTQMKRNIAISFIVQLVIIIFFYLLYLPLVSNFGDWDTIAYITAICGTILIILFYIIAGWFLLKPTNSNKTDIISIFLLSTVLVIISLISYVISILLQNQDSSLIMASITSILNPIEHPLSIFYGVLSKIIAQKLMLNIIVSIFSWFSPFIPSLGLWLGFKLNLRKM